jgi:hypothetical protein
VIFTGLAFFLIACASPALVFITTGGSTEVWEGAKVLGLGWMGMLVGQIAWCANPVMVLSLIFLLFRRWLAAAILTLVALAIAANTLLLFSQEIPVDEASTSKLRLEHLGIGFYFWVASMIVVVVGAIILRRRGRAGCNLTHKLAAPGNISWPKSSRIC